MVRTLVATLSGFASVGALAGRRTRRDTRARGLAEAPDSFEGEYARGGVEPALEDVLGDPIIQLVMRSDRLDPNDFRAGTRR